MTVTAAEIFALELEKKLKALKELKGATAAKPLSLTDSIKFMLAATDEAIKHAQATMTVGAEKKEFVLTVLRRLYDTGVYPSLPFYLTPFSPWIKSLIIDTLISELIDWIVAKYKEGVWGKL